MTRLFILADPLIPNLRRIVEASGHMSQAAVQITSDDKATTMGQVIQTILRAWPKLPAFLEANQQPPHSFLELTLSPDLSAEGRGDKYWQKHGGKPSWDIGSDDVATDVWRTLFGGHLDFPLHFTYTWPAARLPAALNLQYVLDFVPANAKVGQLVDASGEDPEISMVVAGHSKMPHVIHKLAVEKLQFVPLVLNADQPDYLAFVLGLQVSPSLPGAGLRAKCTFAMDSQETLLSVIKQFFSAPVLPLTFTYGWQTEPAKPAKARVPEPEDPGEVEPVKPAESFCRAARPPPPPPPPRVLPRVPPAPRSEKPASKARTPAAARTLPALQPPPSRRRKASNKARTPAAARTLPPPAPEEETTEEEDDEYLNEIAAQIERELEQEAEEERAQHKLSGIRQEADVKGDRSP